MTEANARAFRTPPRIRAIEQDADLVGLLYRESKNKEGEEDPAELEQDAIPGESFRIAKTTQWPYCRRRSDVPQKLYSFRERRQSERR